MIESIPADYAIALCIGFLFSNPLNIIASMLSLPMAWLGFMALKRKIT